MEFRRLLFRSNRLPAISGAFALLYLGFLILSVSVEANLYLNGRYWLPFYVALVLAATPLAARLRRSHGIQHHIATAAAVLALLLVGAHALRTVDRKAYGMERGV